MDSRTPSNLNIAGRRIASAVGLVLTLAFAVPVVTPVAAQVAAPDVSSLLPEGRARAEVRQLLAEAASAGLPSHQLQSKIREGAARGAMPERIVAVVRANIAALHEARAALGAASTADEIEAGAGALRAGVPNEALTRARTHRPRGDVTTVLAVWTDLVTRGVPTHVVGGAIDRIMRIGPGDETLLALREAVAVGAASSDAARPQDLVSRFVDGLDRRAPPTPRRPPS